ncbi:hypothetical protein B0H63DRAFT_529965 [Podospora didyma]|uniref:Uncharacterized protein n=1 Tax=Podospora didyma TaxID=330526 RepID=A0AAE0JYA9_9PEZI|nr:hypothetical protein B0H63DRAFT_529965 [Podospora didyma]
MNFTDATTATLTDGGSTYDGIDTPSTTDDGISTPIINDLANTGFRGKPASSQAAEDVSQLIGRFGFKMARTLQKLAIKKALFADHKLLRLPCLKYADNFTCRVTKLYAKVPIDYRDSAPLLWWLWDPLLDYLQLTASTAGCKLEFTPAHETDISLPYTIVINLGYKRGGDSIELTASYGRLFCEQRIFDAPIAKFCFLETERYGKSTIATLNIDRHTYKEGGCLAHMLNYLVPRSGNLWRLAMEASPPDKEEILVVAFAGTCKAKDDQVYMSESQGQQCLNLLQRSPPDAKV